MFSLNEILKIVGDVCRKYECIYAVLFGSYARGESKKYSDIDIAVMFRKNNIDYLSKAMDIAFDLEEIFNVKVDVVPLNIADLIVRYQVYSEGILAYCEDYNKYMDDKIDSIDLYLDFSYHFEKFYRKTLREIRDAVSRSKDEDK